MAQAPQTKRPLLPWFEHPCPPRYALSCAAADILAATMSMAAVAWLMAPSPFFWFPAGWTLSLMSPVDGDRRGPRAAAGAPAQPAAPPALPTPEPALPAMPPAAAPAAKTAVPRRPKPRREAPRPSQPRSTSSRS